MVIKLVSEPVIHIVTPLIQVIYQTLKHVMRVTVSYLVEAFISLSRPFDIEIVLRSS